MQRLRDNQQRLDFIGESLKRQCQQFVAEARVSLAARMQSLKTFDPKRELIVRRNKLTDLHRRLVVQVPRSLQNARERFQGVEDIFRVLGPDATLARGYSITTDSTGHVVHSVASVHRGSRIKTRLVDGTFESEVVD
jgi:exodeoxyribonuclease VII large subunit